MEKWTHLNALIEKLAGKITVIDASDKTELETMIALINQLSEVVAVHVQTDTALAAFYKTCQDAAQKASALMQSNSADIQKHIDQISANVAELQTLLQQAQSATSQAVPSASSAAAFNSEDLPLIQDFITESREHIENAEAAMLALENDPKNAETLNQIFRSFHTIKGMAGFLNLSDINQLAHAAENVLDLARKGQLIMTGENSDAAFASMDMLKTMLNQLERVITGEGQLERPPSYPTLMDRLHRCAAAQPQSNVSVAALPAGMVAEAADISMETQTDKKLDQTLVPDEEDGNKPTVVTNTGAVEKIKVSTTKLDDLINMTGELAIAQLMIAEEVKKLMHNDSNLFRKVSLQNKIVRELQELSMSMRMVPIQGAFQKMSRLVRDLAKKAGKQVVFITNGEETELDRNIVDKITDPLVHMMRNAVDHGIEPPQERLTKGKAAQGKVSLSAYHQAGSIVIEVADDGRGLKRDKLIKKAIEKGLISEHQELPDEDVFKLIFHPGFSTAEKITDVSGRGVGMDVVRKNIETLGGKIDIRSVPDQGTTFIIRLPLTLAIIDGQIVTVADQRYIIPINSIVGSLRPRADHISTVQNRGEVAVIRGELIPLVRLHRLFAVSGAVDKPQEALLVIVEEGHRKCALMVDDLIGQQQVVIKNLSGLGKIKGIAGGAIMGDGRISLILDVPGLIDLAQNG